MFHVEQFDLLEPGTSLERGWRLVWMANCGRRNVPRGTFLGISDVERGESRPYRTEKAVMGPGLPLEEALAGLNRGEIWTLLHLSAGEGVFAVARKYNVR